MTFCLHDVFHTYAAPTYAAGNTALIPSSRAMHKALFQQPTMLPLVSLQT
jgi:hypothetical protein